MKFQMSKRWKSTLSFTLTVMALSAIILSGLVLMATHLSNAVSFVAMCTWVLGWFFGIVEYMTYRE